MNESRGLVAGDTRGRQEDLVLGGERQAGGQGARGQGAGGQGTGGQGARGQGAGGQGAGGQGLPPQHLNKMVHKPLFCRLDNDAGPDYRSPILYESIATVGEIRVWWRADFQRSSRVLKKVF